MATAQNGRRLAGAPEGVAIVQLRAWQRLRSIQLTKVVAPAGTLDNEPWHNANLRNLAGSQYMTIHGS